MLAALPALHTDGTPFEVSISWAERGQWINATATRGSTSELSNAVFGP